MRVFDKLDGRRQVNTPRLQSMSNPTHRFFSVKRSVGVRIPPNLSKILYEWGLRDALSKASRCRKTGFHSSKALIHCLSFPMELFASTPNSSWAQPKYGRSEPFSRSPKMDALNLLFGSNGHVSHFQAFA